jgi:hypothetical protein
LWRREQHVPRIDVRGVDRPVAGTRHVPRYGTSRGNRTDVAWR